LLKCAKNYELYKLHITGFKISVCSELSICHRIRTFLQISTSKMNTPNGISGSKR